MIQCYQCEKHKEKEEYDVIWIKNAAQVCRECVTAYIANGRTDELPVNRALQAKEAAAIQKQKDDKEDKLDVDEDTMPKIGATIHEDDDILWTHMYLDNAYYYQPCFVTTFGEYSCTVRGMDENDVMYAFNIDSKLIFEYKKEDEGTIHPLYQTMAASALKWKDDQREGII